MPEAGFYWYYLADAQIKGGDKKAALKSIEKGLSLNKIYPLKEDLNELKEKILQPIFLSLGYSTYHWWQT